MNNIKVKAGRVIRVENTERKEFSNAAKTYLTIWTEDEQGQNEEVLMFTDREIEAARVRGKKNKEDWPKKGLFTDLFD